MEAFLAWVSQLRFDLLLTPVLTAASVLLCITFHETCHGLVALWLGDPTARDAGRLSLNPLRHIDLVGLVMMFVAHFGWAKPVPVDARRFRHPKTGMALTAVAGPVSNVLLSALALMAYSVCVFCQAYFRGPVWAYLYFFFGYTATISAGLAVFNLLPIPPLDGSKVLFSLLPQRWYWKLMRYERYGTVLLLVLLLLGVLDGPLGVARSGLLDWLQGFCFWPYGALVSLFC